MKNFVYLINSIELLLVQITAWIGLGKMKNKSKFWKGFRKFLLFEIVVQGFQLVLKFVAFAMDPKGFIESMKKKVVLEDEED